MNQRPGFPAKLPSSGAPRSTRSPVSPVTTIALGSTGTSSLGCSAIGLSVGSTTGGG